MSNNRKPERIAGLTVAQTAVTLDTWAGEGKAIAADLNRSAWSLGDWYNRGKGYGFGNRAAEITGIPLETIKAAGNTASRFGPESSVRTLVSVANAHRMTALTDPQAEALAAQDLSRIEINAEVARLRGRDSASTRADDAARGVGIEDLRSLAQEMLRILPNVAIAAGGIGVIREAAAALNSLVFRYDAINGPPVGKDE